jgi:GH25 family lysozyme M1 (1,4-beta-N-acetylmuramidase)
VAYIKGVDVASYQSTDYSLNGLDFAFVKATQGTSYTNPKMLDQAQHARSAGLVVGFYHFLTRGRITDQAAYFVDHAPDQAGDILACDWESAPDGTYPSNAEKDAFIRELKRLRPFARVVLYCNRSFWTTRDTTSYVGDGLWIADPSGPAGSPNVQHPWTFHQYATISGIDHDLANFQTRDTLRKWARGLLPPAETGGPVSLTAQQVHDAVWELDQTPAPDDAPDRTKNPTWQAQSFLRDIDNRLRAVQDQLDLVRAQVAANQVGLTTALAKLAALSDSLAQLDVSNATATLRKQLDSITITLHTEENPS